MGGHDGNMEDGKMKGNGRKDMKQDKKNFCDRCGQKIDWEGINRES